MKKSLLFILLASASITYADTGVLDSTNVQNPGFDSVKTGTTLIFTGLISIETVGWKKNKFDTCLVATDKNNNIVQRCSATQVPQLYCSLVGVTRGETNYNMSKIVTEHQCLDEGYTQGYKIVTNGWALGDQNTGFRGVSYLCQITCVDASTNPSSAFCNDQNVSPDCH